MVFLTLFAAFVFHLSNSQTSDFLVRCSKAAEPTPCVGSGGIDHFEVRDDEGDVQFEKDLPAGKTIAEVRMGGSYNSAGHALQEVEIIENGVGLAPLRVLYVFESTSSGLVPFDPPVTSPCTGSHAYFTTETTLACDFNAGYFRFEVLLVPDFDRHLIELMPKQDSFTAFPAFGRRAPRRLKAAADLPMYVQHEIGAPHSTVRIAAGETMVFYQSDPANTTTGRIVVINAWVPIFMKAIDDDPAEARVPTYDKANLWLQVQVNGRQGWIHGDDSFCAIGLPSLTRNK